MSISSAGTWTLRVAEDACLGSGQCVGAQPERFFLGPNRRAHPRDAVVQPSIELLDVAHGCPGQAILVEDGDGQRLAPEH